MDSVLHNTTNNDVLKFGYIYKITNLANGKIYVGKRQSPKFDLNYWGSGVHIQRAVKKYGKENFKREVLEWCESLDKIVAREIYWIETLDAQNPEIGYNLARGGLGSAGCTWSEESKEKLRKYKGPLSPNWGRKLTDEQRKRLSNSHKGKTISEEHKQKISAANRGRVVSKETREKISKKLTGVSKGVGENNPFYGKHWTEEQRAANGAIIRKALSDPEMRLKMSISHRGKCMPEEQKEKIRAANTGKKRTLEQRQRMSESQKGHPVSEAMKQFLQTVAVGRIWIHNIDGLTKMIYPEEFSSYESQGWSKGRKD